MAELLQANWWLLLIALLIGVLVAWWVLVASRKTTVEREEKPEDEKPAKRNQALMDPPPSSPPTAAAAPPLTAVPEALVEAATPPAPAPAAGKADDLTRIKGVGPKLVALLKDEGITSFAQIAAWDDATIDSIDATLGRFAGRIRRDNWVEQARLLAAGDIAAYESRFGKI